MARIAERISGLIEDGVARYEPEHYCPLGMQQLTHSDASGMTSNQCLPPTRRYAQTYVGHAWLQARCVNRNIRYRVVGIPNLHFLEGRFRTAIFGALTEEVAQRIEHPYLIVFESDHDIFISYGVWRTMIRSACRRSRLIRQPAQ